MDFEWIIQRGANRCCVTFCVGRHDESRDRDILGIGKFEADLVTKQPFVYVCRQRLHI